MSGKKWCVISFVVVLFVCGALLTAQAQTDAGETLSAAPAAWLPLVYGPAPAAPTCTPTATVAATPTATPTVSTSGLRFVGTTNQGEVVEVDVSIDHTMVTRYKYGFKLSCSGTTQTGWTETRNPNGWPITDGQFEIRSTSYGKENIFGGAFDATFTSVEGGWLRWLIAYVPWPQALCSNSGTWNATLQP